MATATATTAAPKKVDELELLQEDDEFEEFEQDEYRQTQENAEVAAALWEDDWDDEDVNDDFSKQLRADLDRASNKQMDTS